MKVYHGSSVPVDEIDLSLCRPHGDFGQGFYVTKLYNQARAWAGKLGKRYHSDGFITEFDFHEYSFEDEKLRTLRFDAYDDAWLDFIVFNRDKGNATRHPYDIVEGPVADDQITYQIENYLNGKIPRSRFLRELRFRHPTHQICICTKRALYALEPIDSSYEFRTQLLEEVIIRHLIHDYGLPDEQSVNLYTSSAVFTRISDESSDLYRHPWPELYRMLLLELGL
jgi:hypothetical protein